MDEEAAACAREKKRRKQHLNTADFVPCYCAKCNGAMETPRNEKAHMKRERARIAQAGRPNPPPDPPPVAGPSGINRSPRNTPPTRSPMPNSPRLHSPRAGPSSPRATPPPPRDHPGASGSPPPGFPSSNPSSPARSLRSVDFLDYRASPGVEGLLSEAEARGNTVSLGNVSDLAARAGDFEVGNQANFFANLLGQHEPAAEFEPRLGDFIDLDDPDSPAGSDLGIDDIDFGIPGGDDDLVDDRPRFDFDEERELGLDLGDNPGDDPADDDNEPDFAAFNEPDVIRNAYINAFIQKTRFGATHEALKHQLKAAKRTLSGNPDVLPDDLRKMAQTIRTAEKRLGLSTSDMISTRPVCPICERRYDYEYIADTDNDNCVNVNCPGILFTEKTLASGDRRRVPNQTYPTASLKAWIQRMLLEPGKSELLQNWRTGPDDHEQLTEPISADEWLATTDRSIPLGDITMGCAHRERFAGMQRVVVDPDEAGNGPMAQDLNGLDQP
ncbi:hypothetical protein FRC09_005783, partial [Ceratobasidium sp. 395]